MPRPQASGTMKKLRSAELTRLGLMTISPPSGFSRPATQRSKVVFPDPLKPSSTKNSCSATSIVTASTACTASPPEWKIFRRFLIEIIVWDGWLLGSALRNATAFLYLSTGDLQLGLRRAERDFLTVGKMQPPIIVREAEIFIDRGGQFWRDRFVWKEVERR